ncbi:enoyl-CoA hydratase/isomerase family protein [Henriciella sp. AS95]|uniref:enoyl-CoA hydratase/isomerase family protein n=1 Tax=Henriciella sp. AS95 TaxID=3135782 RepID=UPI00317E838D
MAELVKRETRGGAVHLILNRPDKLNALTVGMFSELRDAVEDLQNDNDVKCVVIRGEGRCFSAGHDLGDIGAGEDVPSKGWHSETLRMLELLPQPVIAAVHSHCYTGALEVAMAADFIVASDDAKFADTHAKWALTPIWGMSQRLPRRVGIATAKMLMFTAQTLDAAAALDIGLCEAVYPAGEFLERVDEMTRQIVENSSFSTAAYKRLLNTTDGMPLDAGLAYEVFHCEGVGPDMGQRLQAFSKR